MTPPEPTPTASCPPPWARTARQRRLLFVAGLAPGVLCAALGPALAHDPGLLAFGVLLIVLAVVVRRVTQPRCLAQDTRRSSPAPHVASTLEPVP